MGTPDSWGYKEPWRISGWDGYRLRTGPGTSSEIIVELDERWHIIKFGTGQVKGDWAEIVVEEVTSGLKSCYTFEELAPHLTGREMTGWIKVLGDDGEPNFVTDGIC